LYISDLSRQTLLRGLLFHLLFCCRVDVSCLGNPVVLARKGIGRQTYLPRLGLPIQLLPVQFIPLTVKLAQRLQDFLITLPVTVQTPALPQQLVRILLDRLLPAETTRHRPAEQVRRLLLPPRLPP